MRQGWFIDPADPDNNDERYWSGENWTCSVRRDGRIVYDLPPDDLPPPGGSQRQVRVAADEDPARRGGGTADRPAPTASAAPISAVRAAGRAFLGALIIGSMAVGGGLVLNETFGTADDSTRAVQRSDTRTSPVRIGAVCADGMLSTATGQGACSWHGGVARWRHASPARPDRADGSSDGAVPEWLVTLGLGGMAVGAWGGWRESVDDQEAEGRRRQRP